MKRRGQQKMKQGQRSQRPLYVTSQVELLEQVAVGRDDLDDTELDYAVYKLLNARANIVRLREKVQTLEQVAGAGIQSIGITRIILSIVEDLGEYVDNSYYFKEGEDQAL